MLCKKPAFAATDKALKLFVNEAKSLSSTVDSKNIDKDSDVATWIDTTYAINYAAFNKEAKDIYDLADFTPAVMNSNPVSFPYSYWSKHKYNYSNHVKAIQDALNYSPKYGVGILYEVYAPNGKDVLMHGFESVVLNDKELKSGVTIGECFDGLIDALHIQQEERLWPGDIQDGILASPGWSFINNSITMEELPEEIANKVVDDNYVIVVKYQYNYDKPKYLIPINDVNKVWHLEGFKAYTLENGRTPLAELGPFSKIVDPLTNKDKDWANMKFSWRKKDFGYPKVYNSIELMNAKSLAVTKYGLTPQEAYGSNWKGLANYLCNEQKTQISSLKKAGYTNMDFDALVRDNIKNYLKPEYFRLYKNIK